jgi:hypothetical protein
MRGKDHLVVWLGAPKPIPAQLRFFSEVLGEYALVHVRDFDSSNRQAFPEVAKLLRAFGADVVVPFAKKEELALLAEELLRRGLEVWYAASRELHVEPDGTPCPEFNPDTDILVRKEKRGGAVVHKRFETFLRVVGVKKDGTAPQLLFAKVAKLDYVPV